jgi:hypothetical protein
MMFRPPQRVRDYLQRLPTADLYFLNPLRAWRRAASEGAKLPRTRILAPNVYALGRTGVVVRYGREADLDLLRRAGIRRVVYIADDDFAAGAKDERLPARYREKLAAFAAGAWPVLRDAADIVLVPGSVLAEIYGPKARIAPPVWQRPPAPQAHFGRGNAIKIAYLGTGSHLPDLADYAPAIAAALDAHPDARLTLFTGENTPNALREHRQVKVSAQMAWWRYKLALPRMRFHLALYPLADTPFSRARSANKLYEHALTGAASLMSPNPALQAAAGPDLKEVFVENPEDWTRRLREDISDREGLRRRAEATRKHIAARDPTAESIRAWREILSEEIK